MIETLRKDTAARRAVLNIKLRLAGAGIFIKPKHKDHSLMAFDFRAWAETETNPDRKATLRSLGNLSENLGRAAFKKVSNVPLFGDRALGRTSYEV